MAHEKIIIYQIFTRLFGNKQHVCKPNGSLAENGCGKMSFFDAKTLRQIKDMGTTHVWYTGIIRHASCTDYSSYGVPRQHPAVVKGQAGSPYAIADYYDVDPDLAENVDERMAEFESLIARTHKAGLKVIIDFVPNHVARQYRSVAKPSGIRDLGEDDNANMGFAPYNNFYYCVGQPFSPDFSLSTAQGSAYTEFPAKATGNDHFDNHPSVNDWYETVKLNYGVDYCDAGGRSVHFDPVPSTWVKMVEILNYWAKKGIDGFRCDMAEMVPVEFWNWAINRVKSQYPDLLFIAEVYNPSLYRCFVGAGFDYLYDKVGMYDTMRSVICGNGRAANITHAWQAVDDINSHMLYFLENHDEQRIASDYFAGDGYRAIPALMANVLMRSNPFMLYAGQEYGERGMDAEGFSGRDGRTTIFDYWTVSSLYHAYVDKTQQKTDEAALAAIYKKVLRLANKEKAIQEGDFFDLMYVNPDLADKQYAFIRKCDDDLILVVVNFSSQAQTVKVNVPEHAFSTLSIPKTEITGKDLLTGKKFSWRAKEETFFSVELGAYSGKILKCMITNETEHSYVLNDHNKEEFPPAHTAEHLLNRTMMNIFGCARSENAHIERKKSKMTFVLDHKPSKKEERSIEDKMNELIAEDLTVKFEFVDINNLPEEIDKSRLPDNVSDTIRLVRIGDYDVCPCVGKHVRSTSQIGHFVMLGSNWDEMTHSYRIRYKVVQ